MLLFFHPKIKKAIEQNYLKEKNWSVVKSEGGWLVKFTATSSEYDLATDLLLILVYHLITVYFKRNFRKENDDQYLH